jgi:hypothetical protein
VNVALNQTICQLNGLSPRIAEKGLSLLWFFRIFYIFFNHFAKLYDSFKNWLQTAVAGSPRRQAAVLQPPCAMAFACGQPPWAMAVVFLI